MENGAEPHDGVPSTVGAMDSGSPKTEVPFHTLCFGDASTQPLEGAWVVRTGREWQESWERLEGCRRPLPPLPPVNWENDMVIVFALGGRSSGGFAARVERLRIDHQTMYVFAYEKQPGRSCFTTTAVTNPYHGVITHQDDRPIELIRRVEIVECK